MSHQIDGRGGRRALAEMEGQCVIYHTFHCIIYEVHVGDSNSISLSSLYLFQRLQRDVCLGTMKKPIWLSRAFVDRADQPILSSYILGKYKESRLKSRTRRDYREP